MPSKNKNSTEKKGKNKGSVKVNKKDLKRMSDSKGNDKKVKSRFADIEKGDFPNKESAYIESYLSVSRAKDDMTNYIKNVINQPIVRTRDGEETEVHVSVKSAHFAYTLVAEFLITRLINDVKYLLKKDRKKADMYDIKFENLRQAIRNNTSYGYFIRSLAEGFDPATNNYEKLFFDKKNFAKSLERKGFAGKKNIQIDSSAKNFICYLVSTTMNEIVRQSVTYCRLMNRFSININVFTASSLNIFRGEIANNISVVLDDLRGKFSNKDGDKLVKKKIVTKDEESDGSDKSDDEGSDDDDGSEDEDDEDEDDEEDEDEDDDE
jgi:hypothetical protein